MTVGFRGAKFAIVPVTNQDGKVIALKDGSADQQKHFSVFASLGAGANGGATPEVGLEQVLAVGTPAETWAKVAPLFPASTP